MHVSDKLAIASLVVGISSTIVSGSPAAHALNTVTFGHGAYALSVLGIAGIVAAQYIRIATNPTPT